MGKVFKTKAEKAAFAVVAVIAAGFVAFDGLLLYVAVAMQLGM